MKQVTLSLFTIFLAASTASAQDYLQRYEYMELSNVAKKWGKESFDAKRFKNSDPINRAKMVYSLISMKLYNDKSIKKVFSDLGPSTGYFFSETVPAYVIGNINEKDDELWQVVFLLAHNSQKIDKVRVQKKCCYK